MPPRRGPQVARVVVAHAGERETVVGELVPLLARYLAGFAADADGRVGKEAGGHQRNPVLVGVTGGGPRVLLSCWRPSLDSSSTSHGGGRARSNLRWRSRVEEPCGRGAQGRCPPWTPSTPVSTRLG